MTVKDRLVSRRAFVFGSIALATAPGALACRNDQSQVSRPPITKEKLSSVTGPQAIGDTSKISDEKLKEGLANTLVIQKEADRLGIKGSIAEQRLFAQYGYDRSRTAIVVGDVTREQTAQGVRRLNNLFQFMGKSENPYLKHANDYFKKQQDAKRAILLPTNSITVPGPTTVPLKLMTPSLKDEKIHWRIAVDLHEVFNNSSGVSMTTQLAHEIKHLQDDIEYVDSLDPSLTEEQRLEKLLKWRKEQSLEAEVRAYAVSSRAFIHALGLLRINYDGLTEHERLAVNFIQTGSDPKSEQWRNYIKARVNHVTEEDITEVPSSS